MAKAGRKAKHFITDDGRIIEGLTKSSDGRFRPVGIANVSFGSDEAKAIHNFKVWKLKQTGIELLDNNGGIFHGPTEEGRLHWSDYYRNLILTNPKKAALELNCEPLALLANVANIKPPPPSLKLSEVWEMFQARQEGPNPAWMRQAKIRWNDFENIVAAKTLADITVDDISNYHDAIYEKGTEIRHKFGHIKSILSYAIRRGKDQEQIQRVLTLCKMLVPPKKKSGFDPHPIDKSDFAKLLKVADEKWRAVLLLSLNAALYPNEVASVKKAHVDLSKKTLVMDRGKTGCPRVAVLWNSTVKAIKEYQAKNPHESEYIFVTYLGTRYDGNHVSRNFRTLRETAELPETVQFAHIRDGAYTVAVESGADVNHARLLAGHRLTGVTDAYVKRNPKMVEKACKAIVEYYKIA